MRDRVGALENIVWLSIWLAVGRAALTIGKTSQMPGASRFWGPCASVPKHSLNVVFLCFQAVHHASKL